MATEIGEPVKVMAVFDRSTMRPVKFRWRDRVYRVRVTHAWRSRDGASSIMHFSVTDGAALYELAYHGESMRWTVERVDAW
jgi:hypothetical protein